MNPDTFDAWWTATSTNGGVVLIAAIVWFVLYLMFGVTGSEARTIAKEEAERLKTGRESVRERG